MITLEDIRRARAMGERYAREVGAELREGLRNMKQQRELFGRYGLKSIYVDRSDDPLMFSSWAPHLYYDDDANRVAVVVIPTEIEWRRWQREHGKESNPNVVNNELVYRVVAQSDGAMYVEGLPGAGAADTILLVRYPAGDVDFPHDADTMQSALYDLWQTSDELNDALQASSAKRVVFVTPYGRFMTDGVHVVPYRKNPPPGLTAKGERMYEHIKEGYGRDPRRKEIAARTVIARAKEQPELGLARKGYYGNPDQPMINARDPVDWKALRAEMADVIRKRAKTAAGKAELARQLEGHREDLQTDLEWIEKLKRSGGDTSMYERSAREERIIIELIEKTLGLRGNPDAPPQFQAAKRAFEGFHDYEMRQAGKFAREIVIPERLPFAGPCKWVTYRSDKWQDGTHDYIHEIESYPSVKVALPGERFDKDVPIPQRVRDAVTLSQIGLRALGFAYEDGDAEVEAKLPKDAEWFWSPTGKALYCIKARRKLVALIWGGNLDVEPRGIVG
jgi:hypothetical protein